MLATAGGKVRLVGYGEYPEAWDPAGVGNASVWESLHQILKAFKLSGGSGAAPLLARMPERESGMRQLAYLLYTLCERKGWAEEAQSLQRGHRRLAGHGGCRRTRPCPAAQGHGAVRHRGGAGMKAWREVAVPHDDVMKGNFQEAEFAADITRVHDGSASPEYRDPELFYRRTFITEGMKLLLDAVVRRLAGTGGEPVIQLQTAFGGGKTHTMLAVYHLVCGKASPARLAGIPPILDAAGVLELPKARLVVLDGIALSPDTPRNAAEVTVRTLWGELAWQLGGEAAFREVAQADGSGVSPGKEVLIRLLAAHAPCVILVDELTAYIRQFPGSTVLAGGTFDSNLSFVQALTEALKAVPTAVLLAALPESWQAGGPHGVAALAALKDYFGRVHAIWKPVGTEESFEIVRRRLFTDIADPAAVEETCRAFAKLYADKPGRLSAVGPGGPLLRAHGPLLSDPPRGLRPALRGLDPAGELPAHPRGAEADGQGDPPAVAGRQHRRDDPAGKPSAV